MAALQNAGNNHQSHTSHEQITQTGFGYDDNFSTNGRILQL